MSAPSAPAPSGYRADDGAAYERFLGRWTQRLAEPFLDFADVPPEGDLLDVGCGTGSLSLAMAARWPRRRITGVDLSEAYLAAARLRGQGSGDAVRFERADATRLPYPSGAFSGSLAQLVCNFVADADAAAGEMRRVVRPGGVVAACVWDFRGGLVYQRLFWDTAAGVDPDAADARDRLFSGAMARPDGLLEVFRRRGLSGVERTSLTIRMDYADFDDYWAPLLGGQGPVGTYVTGLAPERQRDIKARVRAAYLSGAPDGPRSMTAAAWAVRGVVP
jgi:SAM-dependent methyltransferase